MAWNQGDITGAKAFILHIAKPESIPTPHMVCLELPGVTLKPNQDNKMPVICLCREMN